METKELGYVVCGAACFAILVGAILVPSVLGGLLVMGGFVVIVGWFIGLLRQRRSER